MAESRGIRAGAAYVELFIKDSSVVKGLEGASKRLKAFGEGVRNLGAKVAGVGAMVTAPLVAFAKVFASGAHELERMSQRTGISIEVLSELGYAAQVAGVDMEDLEKGIRKMQKTIVGAATGSSSAQESLKLLNLTIQDLDGLSPDEQFKLIGDRLSQIADPTIRAALAMEMFGRAGTTLLPMLSQGAAGIEAFQQEARRLGLTASTEGVHAGAKLERTLNTLWLVLKKVGSTLGAAITPMLTRSAERMIALVVKGTAWIKQNKELVITIFKVALVVKLAGLALIGLGYVISTIGGVFGTLAGVISGVGTAIGVLGAVLAWLATPAILVIAAVAALAVYLLYATGAGAKALAWLGAQFIALKDTALQAYQGIADALAAGDIRLAARILWLTLKLAWDNGVAALQQVWIAFTAAFVKLAYGAFYGALAATEYAWHAMKVVWIEGVAFLQKLWTEFASWHAKAVEATADAMVKAWIWAREKTGAITADEAQFERNYAQGQHNQAGQKIESDRKSALDAAQKEHDAAMQAESQRHESQLAGIGEAYQGIADAADAERAQKAKAAEEALAQARKEWQDSLAQAKTKRQAAEGSAGPPLLEEPKLDNLAKRLGSLGELMDQKTKSTIGVAGTFNAMEARGLGAGGVSDRIANATEATAKNTKKLLDKLQEQQAEFD